MAVKALFFVSSRAAYQQITNVFDFLWPTAVAMWNMRWQIDGYLGVQPNASEEELSSRFVAGSRIHGVNIRRAFVQHSWEDQQEWFAQVLLINVIALYESWVETILHELGEKRPERVRQLQFPTNGATGVWPTINQIVGQASTVMADSFYPTLVTHRKNSKTTLDNLLHCYRYFKECRNSLVHRGGIANSAAVVAYQAYQAVANTKSLGVAEVPDHRPIVQGGKVSVSLRGVVGLCDVVLRMIATLDAELTRAKSSEKVFLEYWREMHGGGPVKLKYSAPVARRKRSLLALITKLALPMPLKPNDIESFLIAKGAIARS